jgi:hypothetical protein
MNSMQIENQTKKSHYRRTRSDKGTFGGIRSADGYTGDCGTRLNFCPPVLWPTDLKPSNLNWEYEAILKLGTVSNIR